jgi:hypothetical protein
MSNRVPPSTLGTKTRLSPASKSEVNSGAVLSSPFGMAKYTEMALAEATRGRARAQAARLAESTVASESARQVARMDLRRAALGSRAIVREPQSGASFYLSGCASCAHVQLLFTHNPPAVCSPGVFSYNGMPPLFFSGRAGHKGRAAHHPEAAGTAARPHTDCCRDLRSIYGRDRLFPSLNFAVAFWPKLPTLRPRSFLSAECGPSSSAAPEQKRRQSDARGPAAAFLALFTGAMPSFKPPAGARAAFEETHTFSKPTGCSCAGAPSSSAAASSPAAGSTQQKPLLKLLSVQLKDTYRKVNPERPVGCDTAPRRFLTHPSQAVANG